MKLSVAIITNNEELRLEKTLLSLNDFADEIIIVDSHSTDNTLKIAEKYQCKIYSEDWKGYGLQKNSAIEKCTGDWILILDADEVISAELATKIKQIISENDSQFAVYKINFTSFCFGEQVKHGGWSNFYRIRLFKRGVGKYNSNPVHEQFITNEKSGKIKEQIHHYTYLTIDSYIEKFSRYTTQAAQSRFNKKKRSSFLSQMIRPAFWFLKSYFFRLGFLDGRTGLILAVLSSCYNFTTYAKLWEMNKKSRT